MTVRCFVDSNVFVYADDRSAGAKRERARELIREVMGARTGVLSLRYLLAFLAGFLATLVFRQGLLAILHRAGASPRAAYQ